MINEAINSAILSALDIVAMEPLEDGSFELMGNAPDWFAHLSSAMNISGKTVRPQDAFLFLEHFLS